MMLFLGVVGDFVGGAADGAVVKTSPVKNASSAPSRWAMSFSRWNWSSANRRTVGGGGPVGRVALLGLEDVGEVGLELRCVRNSPISGSS